MDLGFFRSRDRFVGRHAARLDYGVLVASLEAMQSASPAARAEVSAAALGSEPGPSQDPLVELVLGGAGWREAIAAQGGCFNLPQARNRGNAM